MRRAIARRMSESKQRVPHFYESVVVEMDAVMAALAELNAARDPGDRVTVTAVLIHALAETLVEHPLGLREHRCCDRGSRRTARTCPDRLRAARSHVDRVRPA